MPSPRPLSSGAEKILIFPQILENHVFHVIVLHCYSSKPVLSLLFIGTVICNSTCNLEISLILFHIIIDRFTCHISVHIGRTCIASKSWTSLSAIEMSPEGITSLSAGLIPGMLWAIANHMSLLVATVASYFPYIEAVTSSLTSWCW